MNEYRGVEYSDRPWNPTSGCSHYGRDDACAVWRTCWAHRMAQRLKGRYGYPKDKPFAPTLHRDRLDEPYKWAKPQRVHTCFMGDLFCGGIKNSWLDKVLGIIADNPQHRFYLLTKEALRLRYFHIPDNAWCGVTINKQSDISRGKILSTAKAKVKYVSFEPLIEQINHFRFMGKIDWIIIGAQTNPELQPKKEWVQDLLDVADFHSVPVFMKPNLKVGIPLRQEFPEVE